MSKAVVFIADGTEMCEALITVDVLKRAGIDTVLASVMGRRETVSSHRIGITADVLAEDVDYASVDAVILPGGLEGTENERKSRTVREQVLSFYSGGKLVAAICAAPTILAELGLLDGKTATVHPGAEGSCGMAKLTHGQAAADGNVITGQAVGGTFAFALEIVKALEGEETARRVRGSICL